MSEHRQLSAIMFTDIVGFSALMAGDEKRALAAMQQQREIMLPLLGQFGGRLHKEIGDGTLCSFDSAVAAVLCAQSIQEQFRAQAKFRVRIGIHIGEIVHRGDDIFGDGVNIAARIEPLAPEGGIAVSDAVYGAVRSQENLAFRLLGAKKLKNIGKPMNVYVVALSNASVSRWPLSRRWLWALPLCAVLAAAFFFTPSWAPIATRLNLLSAATVDIGSIAVLPLKPLAAASAQDLLGLGLADAIISELSKSRQITVRPLTAVRGYTALDTDAAAAGKALAVAAVLDGTWQQAGDRLRVNASLIRATDRKLLWNATFDVKATDIFGLQDQVSQAVAAHLRIVLDHELNSKRPSSISPRAYEAYAKGVQSFYKNQNSSPDTSEAVSYFQQALAEAPDFALARARLAYAFLWNAIYDISKSGLYEKALVELHRAEQLDPNLPFLHMIRGAIANSEFGQWQLATAYREFRTTERLDPTQVDFELAGLYFHVGLEEQAHREVARLLALNPENVGVKEGYVDQLWLTARPDEAAKVAKELLNKGPPTFYYLEKRMIYPAAERLGKYLAEHPEQKEKLGSNALLLALQGRHVEAQAMIRKIVAQSTSGRATHHETFTAARIHALGGDAKEAVRWLQITADTGFPNLPLFKRDPMLAQIRESAEFKAFVTAMEPRWTKLVAEFQSP